MTLFNTECHLAWDGSLNTKIVDLAVHWLKRGEVVALPTETVYGLAANALDDAAVAKIFAVKGRPTNHPLIIHVPNRQAVDVFADLSDERLRQKVDRLLNEFSPGPLTLILPRQMSVAIAASGGHSTIAVRVVDHPVFSAVSERFQGLAAPSANRYGHISPTCAMHVYEDLAGKIPLIVDGGAAENGLESTILYLPIHGEAEIVRPGPLGRKAIEQCLGECIQMQERFVSVEAKFGDHASQMETRELPASPGNLEKHYAPNKPLIAISASTLQEKLRCSEVNVGVLGSKENLLPVKSHYEQKGYTFLIIPDEPSSYGKALYHALRVLDASPVEALWVVLPEGINDEAWNAVRDRLQRALT